MRLPFGGLLLFQYSYSEKTESNKKKHPLSFSVKGVSFYGK